MTAKIQHQVLPPKQVCVEKTSLTTIAPLSLRAEEQFRKKMFQQLCFQKCSLIAPKEVYFIVSNLLTHEEKIEVQIKLANTMQLSHSDCQLVMIWVNIPMEAFFQREQFTKMKRAIDTIPLCQKVYVLVESILIQPVFRQQKIAKQVIENKTAPDKMIFINQRNDPKAITITNIMAKTYTTTLYYYLDQSSSQDPLRRLTKQSQVYFFENDKWVLQTPKLLTARGFRVVESFPKKQALGNCTRKRRFLSNIT